MSEVSGQRAVEDVGQPWHRLVNPAQRRASFASTLGWILDGYEGFAIALVPALTTLMPGADGGYTISGMLLGWATSGALGGFGAAVIFALVYLITPPALLFLPKTTRRLPPG